MVKIYLTRHGETIENSLGLFQGHAPGHLPLRPCALGTAAGSQASRRPFGAG